MKVRTIAVTREELLEILRSVYRIPDLRDTGDVPKVITLGYEEKEHKDNKLVYPESKQE